jgi:3-oxoacyl-[acyl-carrier-protein] synthase-1/3-oxoacyl-[acyl-carrier-protein] synthase II
MIRIDAIAIGAVSARGRGRSAYAVEEAGEAARGHITRDEYLAEAGLARPSMARATALGPTPNEDRATQLLTDALAQLVGELDRIAPDWRARRLGVCIGTSSGGMLSAERWFEARATGTASETTARAASYFAPLDGALAQVGLGDLARRTHVVAACASSTIAVGIAMRWLQRGACDLVLAGGYDAVSLFVAAGFEALRATTATTPRPFRVGRDGMALGEGAGVLALVRAGEHGCTPLASLVGFGASCDSVHITAPDRDGEGLVRAALAALSEARLEATTVDLVSAHGTATSFNDSAEAKAIASVCPGDPVVHPFKAQIGHTLGAAGVLELVAMTDALARGVAPAALGEGEVDPGACVKLLSCARATELRAGLKLSAAFGGVTAALVAVPPGVAGGAAPRALRSVAVVAHAAIEEVDRGALVDATGLALDRLARIDDLGLLALMAVTALRERVSVDRFVGAGIVGGHGLATLDTNERFYTRLRDKGPRWVDPRLFPATSPNAGVGHCAIAFGVRGPSFAVNAGLGGGMEAVLAAGELIAAGDVDRMIVVAADDDGPAARHWLSLCEPHRSHARGAIALLLEAATPGHTGRTVDLDAAADHRHCAVGHLALRDWLQRS